MSNVDNRCLEVLVKPLQFGSHLYPQLRVKVGERFVEEEDFWVSNNRSPDCDPLSLTTGKLLWLSIQQLLYPKNTCRFCYPLLDLRL